MFAPVRSPQNQAWRWHLDSDTMEYVSSLNQRLCNHPADFSVRMVDYSKWDKLQTSDEEDAKPQPPPIPVPWTLEAIFRPWTSHIMPRRWEELGVLKLQVTCSNIMRSVGFCWLVQLLYIFYSRIPLVWIHRGAAEISCISQTSASSLWLPSRKITQQGRREVSRLAWYLELVIQRYSKQCNKC